ncbi:hypothetical protein FA95DRAFT_1556829 [Auriscalpium vulgare]|uniref:Uncharacterized protein n=1 Tax=Auriscalpium vulgare TaxID=40419 RepID=A0ACB8RZH5_9AGAM|nr:hypothetical protein FA95DRAFT_1556829 [Auriscalpium vulgare]
MYGAPYGSQQHQPYPPQDYPQPAQPTPTHPPREHDPRESHTTPRPNPHPIGTPITFATGQFSGKKVRAELVELQKADLGRKYARKDRRPLDPPPVVQLRLYVVHEGSRGDVEIENYDEINNMGLICHVDLFPVPSTEPGEMQQVPEQRRRPESTASPSHASTSTMSPTPYSPGTQPYPYTYPAPQPPYSGPPPPQQGAMAMLPPMQMPPQQYGADGAPGSPNPEEVVHYFNNNFPISEGSKCTESLAGTTFVQAANLDYKGNKVLMFVFSDLAVKMEGNFILRYRCFDLFSKVSGGDVDTPVWAECYGGAFRVYSTKEFPGLRASTDLTKHLSYFGVRLNLRESERKRRKKVDEPMASSGRGKGKRRDDDDGDGYRSYDD